MTDDIRAVLNDVARDPWGRVSASVYETARLVALAPWLAGHRHRLAYLCRTQSATGGWGPGDGYGLVPTLSAADALLAELARPESAADGGLRSAAERALAQLDDSLKDPIAPPDTIAVEFVVPALVESLNARLGRHRFAPPAAAGRGPWHAIRARLGRGEPLPHRMWPSLEAFCPSEDPPKAANVQPGGGAVGCSAAATAAWLEAAAFTADPRAAEAVAFLDRLQARGGGPVPGVTPITFFERAWVLNSARVRAPVELVKSLAGALGPHGAPAAPGLPPDADDTAAVLSALLRHGRPYRPDVLLGYFADGYFRCFPGERTPSVSTNAHALEALALYARARPTERARYAPAMAAARSWLCDRQDPGGAWTDKWHASPYYATACCGTALAAAGGPRARDAITRAVAWVLDSQRAEGGWGRWAATAEETAYALQLLSLAGAGRRGAAARGRAFLSTATDYPALWHAKDLYAPVNVIRAAVLAQSTRDGAATRPGRAGAG